LPRTLFFQKEKRSRKRNAEKRKYLVARVQTLLSLEKKEAFMEERNAKVKIPAAALNV